MIKFTSNTPIMVRAIAQHICDTTPWIFAYHERTSPKLIIKFYMRTRHDGNVQAMHSVVLDEDEVISAAYTINSIFLPESAFDLNDPTSLDCLSERLNSVYKNIQASLFNSK